jgi:hypothetical protein
MMEINAWFTPVQDTRVQPKSLSMDYPKLARHRSSHGNRPVDTVAVGRVVFHGGKVVRRPVVLNCDIFRRTTGIDIPALQRYSQDGFKYDLRMLWAKQRIKAS